MEHKPVTQDTQNTQDTQAPVSRKQQIRESYRAALTHSRTDSGLERVAWMTWLIAFFTFGLWCFTAYQVALAAGAHSLHTIALNIANNAINVQDKDSDALSRVLIAYGAKDNDLMRSGQYWRFITPIFLHANALHVGLNMLNFVILGTFIERLIGHIRFLLIYLATGVVSVIASFAFMPQEISVGASGAIFGLVGAYSIFVFVHRKAFPRGGIPALVWLIFIIGVNLCIGLFVQNVDNYAHIGGLLSGCLLGWWFMPLFQPAKTQSTSGQKTSLTQTASTLVDTHSLIYRWPLALLTIAGTLILAIAAVYRMGG